MPRSTHRSVLGSSQKGNNAHAPDLANDADAHADGGGAGSATPSRRAAGLAKSVGTSTPASVRGRRWQAPTMSSLAKVVGSIRSVRRGKRPRAKLPENAGEIDPFVCDGRGKENIDPFASDGDYRAGLMTRSVYGLRSSSPGGEQVGAGGAGNVEAAFVLARSAPASSRPSGAVACWSAEDEKGGGRRPFVGGEKGGGQDLGAGLGAKPALSFRVSTFQPFALGFDAPQDASQASQATLIPPATSLSLPAHRTPPPSHTHTNHPTPPGPAPTPASSFAHGSIDWAALDRLAAAAVELPALFADLEMDGEGRMRPASRAEVIAGVRGGGWGRYAAVRTREL